jgi:hypothetical protein
LTLHHSLNQSLGLALEQIPGLASTSLITQRGAVVGTIGSLVAVSLVGCAQQQQMSNRSVAPISAVADPRPVQLAFPDADRLDEGRPELEPPANSDEFAPMRPSVNELLGMLAEDSATMPERLKALREKSAEANAAVEREPQAASPSQAVPPPVLAVVPPMGPPETAPSLPSSNSPSAAPVGSTPSEHPALAAASSEAPVAPVAPTAVSDTARSLADAITAALQTNAGPVGESRPVTKAVAAALSAIADPAKSFDVTAFDDLEDEEREFVVRLHDASAAVGRDLADGKPIGEAVAKLAEAIKAVEPERPLLVKRSEFATKVEGFGQLNPIGNRRFLPGRNNQVIVYTELDGFTSERNEKNEWVTNLATKIQILAKHDGTEVWSRNWQAVTDVSSVRREDFFVCEKVTLSEFLTIGTYVLKVSVRDERTQAIAEKSVEFSMVADPALAAR